MLLQWPNVLYTAPLLGQRPTGHGVRTCDGDYGIILMVFWRGVPLVLTLISTEVSLVMDELAVNIAEFPVVPESVPKE